MSRRVTITTGRRTVAHDEDDAAPFWLEHLVALVIAGVIVVAGALVLLSLTDRGRAALVWLGLALGLVMACGLAIGPWRSRRAGKPPTVWIGEALSAFGWSATTVCLAAGIPYVFWRGPDTIPEWAFAVPGVGAVVFMTIAGLGVRIRRQLPALNLDPRRATVLFNDSDADGRQSIALRYQGVDGEEHDAELADMIDDSWLDRFAPGTIWQVYAFRDPMLATSVLFLTEAHDDVWRNGYKLDGVRLGGEGGPVRPGPGSPFFGEDST
ncbi:hypothetical protein [Gordonia humi]|uniref:Uncharacterized protein n=1 Tax=Gordonia humi TaxID=686429 RepID=A0A840F1I4_9ACTN|nr:hypothetical protein [Gordonia humi]MBB4136368.1 hypothetical protein [Gordonia humi]